MIPRIVLEPSLLWFLYVGPNKEFFCSGPLQSSLARPGVCVFIKLFIFPTPWPGPGVDWQDWGPWRDDWRENKNSDKTISGWFLSLHRRLGRLGVSMFWFYPLTANDCSSVRFVWLAGWLVSLSWSDQSHLPTARYRHSYLALCLLAEWDLSPDFKLCDSFYSPRPERRQVNRKSFWQFLTYIGHLYFDGNLECYFILTKTLLLLTKSGHS